MATPIMYEPACLYSGYAPDTSTAVYTAPADKRIIVKEFLICNDSEAPVVLLLNRVSDGDSAGGSNRLLRNTIAAGATVTISTSTVLEFEDAIYAEADTASAIALTISGQVEQT